MKKYGLIGKTLRHSFSPQIHALLGDYDYKLYEMSPEEVPNFLALRDFGAINVTIPYKQLVMPHLDYISPEATEIGSVNTIVHRENGELFGYNTDYYGFCLILDSAKIDVRGKKVAILGSGGSCKTAFRVCTDRAAREIVVISRTGENNYENIHLHHDAEVIINTTPLGMYPNNGVSPVNLADFSKCCGVAEVIYNPSKTALLLDAERLGIPHHGGLVMLVGQAIKASEIFFDKCYPSELLDSVMAKISSKMLNIVLVGMPGCGKSSVGKKTAEMLGRKFIDLDEEITKTTKKPPSAWIISDGEAKFREIEHSVLQTISKESTVVIASGGGAVTYPPNLDLLRQNGTVIFLNRDVNDLATADRPLSGDLSRRLALLAARLPLYRSICDLEIAVGSRSVDEISAEIIQNFTT